jgi:hypothetical protein
MNVFTDDDDDLPMIESATLHDIASHTCASTAHQLIWVTTLVCPCFSSSTIVQNS